MSKDELLDALISKKVKEERCHLEFIADRGSMEYLFSHSDKINTMNLNELIKYF